MTKEVAGTEFSTQLDKNGRTVLRKARALLFTYDHSSLFLSLRLEDGKEWKAKKVFGFTFKFPP